MGELKIGEPSVERRDNYIKRVDEFFIANGINDIIRKKAILLSSCGAQLLRGVSDNQPLAAFNTDEAPLVSGSECHS